jgi:arylsulfatase A-like enzyme
MRCVWLVPVALAIGLAANADPTRKPNIVIILSDDAGYADFSMHGSNDIATPHVDSIAEAGVRFLQGYTSSSVCSPSRAGLLTGRYQHRFGHHHNPPPVYSATIGLDVGETTLADALQAEGYRTIAVGKWHLGHGPEFHPLSRGFDDFYGFLHGARSYFPLESDARGGVEAMLRDRDPVPETFDYLTDELGREAAAYIDAHAHRPFFLYLSFNAPHHPLDATDEKLALIRPDLAPRRRVVAAMMLSLDDAVGEVLRALERNGLVEHTLLVFLNDNGGESWAGVADNGPLRGRKGQPYEGGIRVPFVARWPERWPRSALYEHPVSALDLFPTALVAGGGDPSALARPLDGVDLTPAVTGAVQMQPHRTLFWKNKTNFAARDGDWKLLEHNTRGMREVPIPRRIEHLELYNIAQDPSESENLLFRHPWTAARLRYLFWRWESTLPEPRWWPRGRPDFD